MSRMNGEQLVTEVLARATSRLHAICSALSEYKTFTVDTLSSLSVIGPIPWGHSSPLCHALSLLLLLLLLSWTSHAACAIAIAGV